MSWSLMLTASIRIRSFGGEVAGAILIGVFIFVIAPFLENQSDTFKALSAYIDRHDVDTGAYAYTDSELTAQAAIGARSTMEHPPKGPKF